MDWQTLLTRSVRTHFQDRLLRRWRAAQGTGAETAGTRPATCWPLGPARSGGPAGLPSAAAGPSWAVGVPGTRHRPGLMEIPELGGAGDSVNKRAGKGYGEGSIWDTMCVFPLER